MKRSSNTKLRWPTHADLAIKKMPVIGREEYLDYMTFKRNDRPLFTEIFGPIVGLKEEWAEQGAAQEELDFSAFRYVCEARGGVPVNTGRIRDREPTLVEGFCLGFITQASLDVHCLGDDLGSLCSC